MPRRMTGRCGLYEGLDHSRVVEYPAGKIDHVHIATVDLRGASR
jgi:hypothetical protein